MSTPGTNPTTIRTVVKLGGGSLADPAGFDRACRVLGTCRRSGMLVVPGGGALADAVRDLDRRFGLSDGAAHRMAILAMDQLAEMIAERLGADGVVVESLPGILRAIAEGRVPVLAPSRWLADVDPLPHSWSVTGDSIAAWVAGACGARRLVLIKPAGAGSRAVDDWFDRAIPPSVAWSVIGLDQVEEYFPAILSGPVTSPGE